MASTGSNTPSVRAFAARIGRMGVSATTSGLQAAGPAGLSRLDFGVGEPDFATPEHIREAGIAAIRDGYTRYTAIGGLPEAREAVVEAHARDFASHYSPAEAMITTGGKAALFLAIGALVDHGDEVILPAPYWVSFRDQIQFAGGVPVVVATETANGFGLSVEAVRAALTPRTRAIICNSPANPSGAAISPATFQALLRMCRERGIWLISDECYAKFVYDGAPYSVACEPESKDWLVVAGSLSKAYAMTGWRCGYALGPPALIAAMLKLQSHASGSVAGFTQKAAMAALLGPQEPVARMLAEYRRRRDHIVAGLRALPGVSCGLPDGAFYAFPNLRRLLTHAGGPRTGAEFSQCLLEQCGLVTVPGEAFGTGGHIRLSYATSMEAIEEGLERLAPFCAALLH